MTAPKGFRRIENLTPEELADHDRKVATVRWQNVITFDRVASDDPKDHGDQPYEPGPSLMDRERRGQFTVKFAPTWSGGLQFTVDDEDAEANGFTPEPTVVMLDRQQVYLLVTGLLRWLAGTLAGWQRKPLKAYGQCPDCLGTGFRVRGE